MCLFYYPCVNAITNDITCIVFMHMYYIYSFVQFLYLFGSVNKVQLQLQLNRFIIPPVELKKNLLYSNYVRHSIHVLLFLTHYHTHSFFSGYLSTAIKQLVGIM